MCKFDNLNKNVDMSKLFLQFPYMEINKQKCSVDYETEGGVLHLWVDCSFKWTSWWHYVLEF